MISGPFCVQNSFDTAHVSSSSQQLDHTFLVQFLMLNLNQLKGEAPLKRRNQPFLCTRDAGREEDIGQLQYVFCTVPIQKKVHLQVGMFREKYDLCVNL